MSTGKKLNTVIFAVMALALGYFAYDKFVLDASRDAALVESTTLAVTGQAAYEQVARAIGCDRVQGNTALRGG